MQIIPVIDLLNGLVVHAKRGQRQHYQPIQSQLTASSAPLDIVAALLALYPFTQLYIADLNAIQKLGGVYSTNYTVIEAIIQAYPNMIIWLDCGIGQMNARALHVGGNIKPVVGSENVASLQDYRAISYACQSKHVLSLDYTATSAMGITELHNSARFWPDDTICMTLNAVGSAEGADMQRLNEIVRLNTARKTPSRIYAAGGVRNLEDLQVLASMRLSRTNNQFQLNYSAGTIPAVAGALVATALHNGNLNAQDLQSLQQHSHENTEKN